MTDRESDNRLTDGHTELNKQSKLKLKTGKRTSKSELTTQACKIIWILGQSITNVYGWVNVESKDCFTFGNVQNLGQRIMILNAWHVLLVMLRESWLWYVPLLMYPNFWIVEHVPIIHLLWWGAWLFCWLKKLIQVERPWTLRVTVIGRLRIY